MERVNYYGIRTLMDHLFSTSIDIHRRWLMVGTILVLVTGLVWMLDRPPNSLDSPNFEFDVEYYLLKAKVAMEADKLTTPIEDNAYAYYKEVIKQDPDHQDAQGGLTEIANRHADLAEEAITRFEYVKAERYVSEGLRVQADNPRLMVLQKRTNALKDVPNRLIKGIKSVLE